MLPIFIGTDHRQHIAYTVLQHSIATRASKPVAVTPLLLPQLPIQRRGLTDFTFSRYLVPYLCDYQGWALFLDGDFLCLTDIYKILEQADERYAVQVVKSRMQFEWASMMLFNCAACQALTPEFIEKGEPQKLDWGPVGTLTADWNHLVGYDQPRDDAKLVHYTQGIPAFLEMKGTEYYDHWHAELGQCLDSCSWLELMGTSVHAQPVVNRIQQQTQIAN